MREWLAVREWLLGFAGPLVVFVAVAGGSGLAAGVCEALAARGPIERPGFLAGCALWLLLAVVVWAPWFLFRKGVRLIFEALRDGEEP